MITTNNVHQKNHYQNQKKLHKLFAAFKKAYYLCTVFKTNTNRGVAQLASVLAWGASGQEFESLHSDKKAVEYSTAFFMYGY